MSEFVRKTFKPSPEGPGRPTLLRWLPAAFLIVTVVTGSILTIRSKGARDFPRHQAVVTGQWARQYETGLDGGVPFRDASVKLWSTVNYRLFHEAAPDALVGADNWLYTAEEFQTSPGDAAAIAHKISYVEQVRDALARDGTRLVVALIPAKARVYPEHLGPHRVPQVKADQYQNFRRRLSALNILAPDLLTPLLGAKAQGDVFIRTDTHWSPWGAQVAAEALARAIKRATPAVDVPAATFKTTTATTPANLGDLLHYLPLPKGEGPPAAKVFLRTTRQVGPSRRRRAGPAAVVLVGTSYSAVKDWNFDGALEQALGTGVLNVAVSAQGPLVPMRAYLRRRAIKATPPKLVIWEIPERLLRLEY